MNLDISLLPHQADFIESESPVTIMVAGRGTGKTFIAAHDIVKTLSEGGDVICSGPTIRQLKLVLMREITKVLRQFKIPYNYNKQENTISCLGRMIYGTSQESFENARGITEVRKLVMDEAALHSKECYDVLAACCRGNGDPSHRLITTPRGDGNWVSALLKQSENNVIRATTYENTFLSPAYIKRLEKQYSGEFAAQELLGEVLGFDAFRMVRSFILDDGIQVLDNWKTVVGIDLARDGGDKTVVCVRRGKKIIAINRYDVMEIDRLAQIILEVDRLYSPERINVDSTGHGAWAPDAVKAAIGYSVKAINFSDASEDARYRNMRAEIYGRANEYFQQGGTIPNDEHLKEELHASTFHYSKDNKMEMDKKDEIKSRIGRSPDTADAFCLTMLTDGDLITMPSQNIERITNFRVMQELTEAAGYN